MRNPPPALPSTPFWRVVHKHVGDPKAEREHGEYNVAFLGKPLSCRIVWSQGALHISANGVKFVPALEQDGAFSFEWREVKSSRAPDKRGTEEPLRIKTTDGELRLCAEPNESGLLHAVHAVLQWVLHVRASGSQLSEFGIESSPSPSA